MILLDSHVLIWAVADSKRLSKAAASAIRRARRGDGLAVSAITAYEVAWQIALGRIQGYGSARNVATSISRRGDDATNHSGNCGPGGTVSR